MTPLSWAALLIVSVTSVVLWALGRRFFRRYVALTGRMPPWTWMFRPTTDPELEQPRKLALTLLPIYLVALVLYLIR